MDTNNIVRVLKILRTHYKQVSMLGSFTGKDPFYVLISTVLSARNRDEMTLVAVKQLFAKYKTPKAISKADVYELGQLIIKSGFYVTKAKRIKEISRILLEKYAGRVPDNMDDLVSLPGVGRKTAGCVLVYAFDQSAIPVDTHVQKISNRLSWVTTKTPDKTELALMKIVPKEYWTLVNEVFVLHGQNICTPISPFCSKCPVYKFCKRVGIQSNR